MLKDKNILLGVCGSIASYKSAELVRLFVKAGANVKVVMTKDATSFITPLTLSTLSKNPVFIDYYKTETGEWNNHVELGIWANLMIIAPATANTLAKMANGLCDNLLSAVYLSAKCPVYLAPAMDLDMWKHTSTQKNIHKLISYGNQIIKPNAGELASGLYGEGRLAEPQEIFDAIVNDISKSLPLKNKKVLVTAGPTYEAIDPVRFIGNHSSGKMGYAIAEELANQGAQVTLISGPTALTVSNQGIKKIDVISAAEMLETCKQEFEQTDICIMSAAVADYTPQEVATQKIKKEATDFSIQLKKTEDILYQLGEAKKPHQLLIGFALETNDEEAFAIQKLKKKNLDFIVLNSLNDIGAGFKKDTNKITIIDKNLVKTTFELKTKTEVAKDICAKIIASL
ncbi:bifunctional phosphopantothenoylcysteine decarboxylase/phosphopantothenate--cysteine ligase CoaBC [Pedobacter cryophilus]|uniref:Coenzyme A biosynthesis bifunctional protein CoaBC n=1 Tax=Pedobacter cryophilus TaxID=2571271 RepID=A0A4V5NWN3_9SPHI|nr:bifunctional phosphopantothenoylcysteine decarboxylase/phosphopantothenate--cysteine ligase CoaBC [Pedobacter cryophilus]TKB95159.1 bifunctional phosphopantothenoylcysteine decarboxylase/phosphopantothenate--cysteine ligase CoaBC [Pedobacter cryophilus]